MSSTYKERIRKLPLNRLTYTQWSSSIIMNLLEVTT